MNAIPLPECARLLTDDDLAEHERDLARRVPAEQRWLAAVRREKRRRARYAQKHIAVLKTLTGSDGQGAPE